MEDNSNQVTNEASQGEHPSLESTPLAMLEAQCNKLARKNSPPLTDAAVGKGFEGKKHPWKKEAPPHPAGQLNAVDVDVPQPISHLEENPFQNVMEDNSSQVAKEAPQGKHPQLEAKTSVAMQCNKLTSTTLPPFHDPAVGKDLDTLKERKPPSSSTVLQPAVGVVEPRPPYHLDMSYRLPVTSSVFGTFGSYDAENLCRFLPPPPQRCAQGLIGENRKLPSLPELRPAVSETGPQPPYHLDMSFQRPVAYSVSGALGAYGGEHTFYDIPPPPQYDTQGVIGKEREPPSSTGLRPAVRETGSQPPYNLVMAYQWPVTSLVSGTLGAYRGENIFYNSPQNDTQRHIGMVDTKATSHQVALNLSLANQPYESWPSTMNAHVEMENTSTSAIPSWVVADPQAAAPRLGINEASYTLQNSYTNFTHMPNLYFEETKNVMQRDQNSGAPVVAHSPRLMTKQLFACKWLSCGMTFTSPEALDSHLFAHIGETHFRCPFCSRLFVYAANFLNHVKMHNSTDNDNKTGSSTVSCSDTENNRSNTPASSSSSTIDPCENIWQPWNP